MADETLDDSRRLANTGRPIDKARYSLVATGGFGGLIPPNKVPILPKSKYETL